MMLSYVDYLYSYQQVTETIRLLEPWQSGATYRKMWQASQYFGGCTEKVVCCVKSGYGLTARMKALAIYIEEMS